MTFDYDVAVIGTGTSAYHVVHNCASKGLKVAVIDSREVGGTCAMRGCQPKKYLIAASEVIERSSQMKEIGIGHQPKIDWADLIRSKNAFTSAVPASTEAGFKSVGAELIRGHATFTGPNSLNVGDRPLTAKTIVIATGAIPRPIQVPGEAFISTSDDFLNLSRMPQKVLFIGGGFISFEFAMVANSAGADVTILQRGNQVLKQFDEDLSSLLVKSYRDAGIHVHTQACVNKIKKKKDSLIAVCDEDDKTVFTADMVVHGAGRVPDIDEMGLAAGSIEASPRGIIVNEYLQSMSNSSVYAIGDAAATPYQLATTADMEGDIVSHNILSGNQQRVEYNVVPSVVFSLPPLASVGLKSQEAEQQGIDVKINQGDMTGWPSSRRVGQKYAAYKVILNKKDDTILGAHLLGHHADEVINLFAMAITLKIPTKALKRMLWAYPTYGSEIKYMI